MKINIILVFVLIVLNFQGYVSAKQLNNQPTATFPGYISSQQLTEEPVATIYSIAPAYVNGLQPLSDGCNDLKSDYADGIYFPIVVLNQSAYFSMLMDNDNTLKLAVISGEGVNQIKVQKNLQNYVNGCPINFIMSYDDTFGVYYFINCDLQFVVYNIQSDTISKYTFAINDEYFTILSQPYYDYNYKYYYIPFYGKVNGTDNLGAQVLIVDVSDPTYPDISVLVISDLNISDNLSNNYFVSSYDGFVVLFNVDYSTNISFVYLVDPSSNSWSYVSKKNHYQQMISGINNQYVVLVSENGSNVEVINLTLLSSVTYENTCVTTDYTNSFFTSIIPKNIFSINN